MDCKKLLFLNFSFLLLFIVGLILVCKYANVQTALGVFLLLWANNFAITRQRNTDK